jgi:hypothetical protein
VGTTSPTTGAGGRGADGATWGLARQGWPGVNNFMSPNNSLISLDPGAIVYSTRTWTAQSLFYDTGSDTNQYGSVDVDQMLNPGDTVSVQLQGAKDPALGPFSQWVPQNQAQSLNGYRYFRFKVDLQAASHSASPEIYRIQVNLDNPGSGNNSPYIRDFHFNVSGCARVAPGTGRSSGAWLSLLFLVYLAALPRVLRRAASSATPLSRWK